MPREFPAVPEGASFCLSEFSRQEAANLPFAYNGDVGSTGTARVILGPWGERRQLADEGSETMASETPGNPEDLPENPRAVSAGQTENLDDLAEFLGLGSREKASTDLEAGDKPPAGS
jgi:hypothetical protein